MSHKARRRPSWKRPTMYFRPKAYAMNISLDDFLSFAIEIKKSFDNSKQRMIVVNPETARLLNGGE